MCFHYNGWATWHLGIKLKVRVDHNEEEQKKRAKAKQSLAPDHSERSMDKSEDTSADSSEHILEDSSQDETASDSSKAKCESGLGEFERSSSQSDSLSGEDEVVEHPYYGERTTKGPSQPPGDDFEDLELVLVVRNIVAVMYFEDTEITPRKFNDFWLTLRFL